MEDMTMTEIARLIEGLRSAGWEEKKINDFLLYIESGSEEFKPKEEKQKQIRQLFRGCLFCACGYNVSKMYTNCFQNVSADIDIDLD